MRQSEAKDLRSFLEEPVEEIVVEGVKESILDLQQPVRAAFTPPIVGARFIAPTPQLHEVWARYNTPAPLNNSLPGLGTPLQEEGVQFIPPWEGTNAQLSGTGVHFTPPGKAQVDTYTR